MSLFLRPKSFELLNGEQAYKVLAQLGFDKRKLAIYKKRGHSADWVLYNMRLGRYKALRTTKDKFREYFLILRSAGYVRCDLDMRDSGYAKLMTDIGIKNSYITSLDDFVSNLQYENYEPIPVRKKAEIDLMIENRLMPVEAAFVRGFYGLDNGISQSIKNLIRIIIHKDSASSVSTAELKQYDKMFNDSLNLLKEIRDDRLEMIKKLTEKMYDKIHYDIPLNIPIGDALREPEEREELCGYCDRVKRILAIFY